MLQSKSTFYVGKLINIAFLHLKMNVLFSIALCNHGIAEKPNSLYMFMYMEINRSIQKKRFKQRAIMISILAKAFSVPILLQ